MTKLVLASHGPLADALVESSKMLCGENEFVSSICLQTHDSVEVFTEKLKSKINVNEETLVLVDIPGGTPSNRAMFLLNEFPMMRVVSGMNLMMLIECIIKANSCTIDELKEYAINTGKECIGEMQLNKDRSHCDLDDLLE
ncbi:PTS sugar transporter subunit IIA [Anaerorhabdus sp.]|uniref:PTS sugar transporter subunit IIA n=1 Tax=Anaerorhabdus sp. TaxID=1872524 RepID=UPI002FC5E0A9